MIERRPFSAMLRADTNYREMADYDTVRIPLSGGAGVTVTAVLISATWIDLDIKKAHAGGKPEAFSTPKQLTTSARSASIPASDLVGVAELVVTPTSYASAHKAQIVATLDVETSLEAGRPFPGGEV
ncbi:MAG: hypothetical protein U0638_01680 [Phycisphaerales bacterium]